MKEMGKNDNTARPFSFWKEGEEKENDVGANEKNREKGQSRQTSFGCWWLTS